MAETPKSNPDEFSLPYVERPMIDDLLNDASTDDDFIRAEWAELSIANPNLRDLITLTASKEAPDDPALRQKLINVGVYVAGALERALVTQKLENLLKEAGIDTVEGQHALTALEAAADDSASDEETNDGKKPKRRGFLRLGGIAATLAILHVPHRHKTTNYLD